MLCIYSNFLPNSIFGRISKFAPPPQAKLASLRSFTERPSHLGPPEVGRWCGKPSWPVLTSPVGVGGGTVFFCGHSTYFSTHITTLVGVRTGSALQKISTPMVYADSSLTMTDEDSSLFDDILKDDFIDKDRKPKVWHSWIKSLGNPQRYFPWHQKISKTSFAKMFSRQNKIVITPNSDNHLKIFTPLEIANMYMSRFAISLSDFFFFIFSILDVSHRCFFPPSPIKTLYNYVPAWKLYIKTFHINVIYTYIPILVFKGFFGVEMIYDIRFIIAERRKKKVIYSLVFWSSFLVWPIKEVSCPEATFLQGLEPPGKGPADHPGDDNLTEVIYATTSPSEPNPADVRGVILIIPNKSLDE